MKSGPVMSRPDQSGIIQRPDPLLHPVTSVEPSHQFQMRQFPQKTAMEWSGVAESAVSFTNFHQRQTFGFTAVSLSELDLLSHCHINMLTLLTARLHLCQEMITPRLCPQQETIMFDICRVTSAQSD